MWHSSKFCGYSWRPEAQATSPLLMACNHAWPWRSVEFAGQHRSPQPYRHSHLRGRGRPTLSRGCSRTHRLAARKTTWGRGAPRSGEPGFVLLPTWRNRTRNVRERHQTLQIRWTTLASAVKLATVCRGGCNPEKSGCIIKIGDVFGVNGRLLEICLIGQKAAQCW